MNRHLIAGSRRASRMVFALSVFTPGLLAAQLSAAQPWNTPPVENWLDTVSPEANRSHGSPQVFLAPPTPTAIGIHVNMPIIRGAVFGWETFEQTVAVAQAGGFYLLLNNMDGPRENNHIAATFDNWTFDELTRFATILAGSRVPIRLYVGAIEEEGDLIAVSPERLGIWMNDVFWIQQITGSNAGIIVDASSMGEPNRAPEGMSRYQYFSTLARTMAVYEIEIGFEAILRGAGNIPLENRRHYSLLQHILANYSLLPETADLDAQIMSAIDNFPSAVNARRNTIWLENLAWQELADGDPVPQVWLDAWGVSPDQLQTEAATRLYNKGYGLVLPSDLFGIE